MPGIVFDTYDEGWGHHIEGVQARFTASAIQYSWRTYVSGESILLSLFVVVWLAFDDCEGAVELLGEDCSYNLVREGHLRERNLAVCSRIYRL